MAANERAPLLDARNGAAQVYDATAAPEPYAASAKPAHYNLVGLSQTDFWVMCISMWSCTFLSAFDGTIVATLLGPISSSFLASNLASWLGTAYLLSVCCFTPIYGRLCNILGRQTSMLIALGFFSLGNVLCAVAPSMEVLIAARAVAGIGGGGLTSVASTIMSDLVPISHRGIFQGYGNILFGLGSGFGAPIGGLISDKLGWRWAFYLQVPFLVVSAIAIFTKVRYTLPAGSGASTPTRPQTALEKLKRIDFLGCFLLAGFVGGALLAVSLKTSSTDLDAYPWSDPTIVGLFAASAVLFTLFLWVEIKVAAEPVLPVELLTQRTPIAVAANNLLISVLMFASLYSVPLFFMAVRLESAADAGTHLIPNSIVGAASSLGAGFIVRHTGRYYWLTIFGGLCGILSAVMLALWTVETPEWLLWIGFAPQALAMGGVTTLTIVALIADIGREHVAVATSLSYVFRTTGQVLGVSLSGALLQSVLQSELARRITGPDAAETIARIRQSSASIAGLPPATRAAAVVSYQRALQAVFTTGVAVAVLAVIASFGIREIDLRAPPKVVEDEDEA
ncbi:hypothetical protein Q5752_004591 [Cryptotrichosporon argae]